MKRIIHSLLIAFICLLINACSQDAYPIKKRMHKANQVHNLIYETKLEQDNFFQLRINESVEFLPVNSSDMFIDSKNTLISDFPFKKFQQETDAQEDHLDDNKLIIEETYIYLDEINTVKPEQSHNQFGLAFYFITFPTIDEYPNNEKSRTRKYYNNPKRLYANIIRGVLVGHWIKNSKDELLFVFQKSSRRIMVFKGLLQNDKVKIKEVSHPFNLNKRSLMNSKILELVNSVDATNFRSNIPRKKKNQFEVTKLDSIFKAIESDVVLIPLAKVIDLNNKDGLLFFNVPRDKTFLFETSDDATEKITGFKLGSIKERSFPIFGKLSYKPLFYVESTNGNNKLNYLFEKKDAVFLKNDWEKSQTN